MNTWYKFRQTFLLARAHLIERLRPIFVDDSVNQEFLANLGVKNKDVWTQYLKLAKKLDLETDPSLVSFHLIAFIGLALSGRDIRTILELGTFKAQTTRLLAELFPNAEIHTVDLPFDDPILADARNARWMPGETVVVDDLADPEIRQRLDCKNIRTWKVNTLFLPSLPLPSKFDLIWIDASHHYPEVAWDHAFAFSRLSSGGWLFSDDIRLPSNPLFKGVKHSVDAWDVLQYLRSRISSDLVLLLKRSDPILYRVDPKFVALIQNSGVC